MRGHLVAWLLGYSVTDRGGVSPREKKNRKKNLRPLNVYSLEMLGYFGSATRGDENLRGRGGGGKKRN